MSKLKMSQTVKLRLGILLAWKVDNGESSRLPDNTY